MRFAIASFLSLIAGAAFSLGCSASSTPSSLGGRLMITAPSNNATEQLPTDNKLPVSFDTNYVLKPPGTCAGQTGCGSVYLLVDGTACDTTGQAWNTNATSSPNTVDLSLCMMAVGTHAISAELRQDGGEFVENSLTKAPVTAQVTVIVQQ